MNVVTETPTFEAERRSLDPYVIKSIDNGTIHTTDSTGFWVESSVAEQLAVDDQFELETIRWSTITGIRKDGVWLFRKSDQQLSAEHAAFVADLDARERARLAEHRAEWEARTAALPVWVRERITSFQQSGGERFETEGWSYELIIAELAVLYFESDGADSDEVEKFASLHGTSGNQHGFAQALAKAHKDGESVAGTISAFSPITGDPDYSGGGN